MNQMDQVFNPKGARSLFFENDDFLTKVKYRETDYEESEYHTSQSRPCGMCYRRATSWQREVDKLDIFLQQSHDCHGCAMRCCPCGPALKEDSCCVPCRCYSADISDTMTCFQTIPGVSCICLWLFSFPMWLCGNCCASCRCGQETAMDQIFLCCPANKEFGIEHLKQMENSSNDPIDHVEVPGMEKEWCKHGCICCSGGCLHPKVMGMGCSSKCSTPFFWTFICCCIPFCCPCSSCGCCSETTFRCNWCQVENCNKYCTTSKGEMTCCDCHGKNKCPYCLSSTENLGTCCCGFFKSGSKTRSGCLHYKEFGCCRATHACGCLPCCPGYTGRCVAPWEICSLDNTNDQKCLFGCCGLVCCVNWKCVPHCDITMPRAERAIKLGVNPSAGQGYDHDKKFKQFANDVPMVGINGVPQGHPQHVQQHQGQFVQQNPAFVQQNPAFVQQQPQFVQQQPMAQATLKFDRNTGLPISEA